MNDREVLDMADPGERAALAALSARLERTDLSPLPTPPPGLRERTLGAVPASATPASRPRSPSPWSSRPWRRWRRPVVAGGALAVAAVAVALAVILPSDGPQGTLEADGRLSGTGGVATVAVREIGIGRTVDLHSGSLGILPKGQYYEVWFVGPGDTRSRPNRISAGTFHPDAKGRSDVQLKAAVNPRLYPRMEITAEPGDGDPRPSRRVVLAAPLPLKR